jgi:indole-3-glycerol phosphate synthase
MGLNALADILEHKRRLLKEKGAFFLSLKEKARALPSVEGGRFQAAISRPGQINLIAEIKKASPSAGMICENFDPQTIARIYAGHRAAAISVLTEDKYFGGKPEYVEQVSAAVGLPVLTKDFIIDAGQIYEARLNGASAVLLIVAILHDEQLYDLRETAESVGLDCLVEVHDFNELKRALAIGAEIVGINNRNLNTLEVDLRMCETLIPSIPKGKVIVAESGINTHDEIKILEGLGVHAVLIGEAFMREEDIGRKIDEVMRGETKSNKQIPNHKQYTMPKRQ